MRRERRKVWKQSRQQIKSEISHAAEGILSEEEVVTQREWMRGSACEGEERKDTRSGEE